MNFGLPRGTPMRETGIKYNPEVKKLLDEGITDKVEKFEDLPIIHTGCDTYASIYPEFKKYMKDHEVNEVVDYIISLTPEGKWTMSNGQDIHFILTGGEPLLGWQRLYIELFEHPKMKDLKNVTFEKILRGKNLSTKKSLRKNPPMKTSNNNDANPSSAPCKIDLGIKTNLYTPYLRPCVVYMLFH